MDPQKNESFFKKKNGSFGLCNEDIYAYLLSGWNWGAYDFTDHLTDSRNLNRLKAFVTLENETFKVNHKFQRT